MIWKPVTPTIFLKTVYDHDKWTPGWSSVWCFCRSSGLNLHCMLPLSSNCFHTMDSYCLGTVAVHGAETAQMHTVFPQHSEFVPLPHRTNCPGHRLFLAVAQGTAPLPQRKIRVTCKILFHLGVYVKNFLWVLNSESARKFKHRLHNKR